MILLVYLMPVIILSIVTLIIQFIYFVAPNTFKKKVNRWAVLLSSIFLIGLVYYIISN